MKWPAALLWCSSLLAIHIWVWSFTLVSIPIDSYVIRGRTVAQIMMRYSRWNEIPPTHVIVDGHRGRTTLVTMTQPNHHWLTLWPNITHWSIRARPISGDHIHMAMTIYGPTSRVEHDRQPIEDIPYEDKPEYCPVPGSVAYTKMWPHVGVHTHCDGLIHVHPWSAPKAIRQEGLHAQLGLWFDQVGIRYRTHPISLTFSDGKHYANNETHKWRLAEYRCFKDTTYRVIETELDKVWLGHAYASYVMWFGSNANPPPADKSHIEALEHVGHTGFNGYQYPQQCI